MQSSPRSEQLVALEAIEPGKNSPALGAALERYRGALGNSYEDMNVIALGVHGTRMTAFSARADAILMEDAAAEIVSLAASHGLFINQFKTWQDYLDDAAGEPELKMIEAGIEISRATEELPELIADDVVEAAKDLADAAEPPLIANSIDRPPTVVQTELLRSVGNILSGILTPLVTFARDIGSGARKGMVSGSEEFAKMATKVFGWSAMAYIIALRHHFRASSPGSHLLSLFSRKSLGCK